MYNHRVPEAVRLAHELARHLGLDKGGWLHSALDLEQMEERHPGVDVLVTVGGDGTILRATRIAAPFEVPVLGINMGRVGFMTELGAAEALESVERYLEDQVWLEERAMLEVEVHPRGQRQASGRSFHALNEAVVGTRGISRMVTVRATVNDVPITDYRADAVIVATATGSTGHALSAGGPILHPQSRDMVLKPVAEHLGLGAAIVLPSTSTVRLTVVSDAPAMVNVDGFMHCPLEQGDQVRVAVGRQLARFLRAGPPDRFYATMAQRLGLNRRSRERPGTEEGA